MALTIDVEREGPMPPNYFPCSPPPGSTIEPKCQMMQCQRCEKGSLEHVLLLTLTVAKDYYRNADDLWVAAGATYKNLETNYLISPKHVHEAGPRKVVQDTKKHSLSR